MKSNFSSDFSRTLFQSMFKFLSSASKRSKLITLSLIILSLSLIIANLYNSCTSNDSQESGSEAPRATPTENIDKTKGINIGESSSIWAVTQVPNTEDQTGSHNNYNIYNIAMNVEKGFPTKTWKLTTPIYMNSGSGTRTYVSEWGLLMARSATSPNEVTLYLAANDSNFKLVQGEPSGIRAIFTTGGKGTDSNDYSPLYRDTSSNIKGIENINLGRASALSYMVKVNGKSYKFIGIIWRLQRSTPTVRIERFLWNESMQSFTRVRPYEFTPQEDNENMKGMGVYTGALAPCDPHLKEGGECVPTYYGAPFGKVFGVKLNGDVPSTEYDFNNGGPIFDANSLRYLPPNVNPRFKSTSHPNKDGKYGSINGGVYSFSVYTSTDEADEGAGSLFISNQSNLDIDICCSTHVAYDSVNNLVFTAYAGSTLYLPKQTPPSNGRSIISVFRKECFYKTPDCQPDQDPTASDARNLFHIYSDVGVTLGPISDLGNGCLAATDIHRIKESGQPQMSGLYRICIVDPTNLSRGLSVIKIADLIGDAYMYNDFTAATLYERPVILHYDFLSDSQLTSVRNVKFFWEPKPGHSTTMTGLKLSYRCYAKGATISDSNPSYIPISENEIPLAYSYSHPLSQCEGSDITQVDFKIERIEKRKFTRFQKFRIASDRTP